MPWCIVKCEHGVEERRSPSRADEVIIVDCPPECGVRVLAEETMSELPFENADQGRMRREDFRGAEGRFQGHNPYREI